MPRTLAILLFFLPALASAQSAVERLDHFLDGLTTLRGEFRQSLPANGLNPFTEARGHMVIARPGRFRWEYTHPVGQTLVADGRYLWIYDPDLAQVTRRPLGDELGETPAVLLGSDVPIEERFQVIDGGERDGLAWVILVPRDGDSGFEGIRLGFAGEALRRMEMMDLLGRTSTLEFIDLQRNVQVDPEVFHFQPPPDADLFSPLD